LAVTPIVTFLYSTRTPAARAGSSRPAGAPRQVIVISVDTLRRDAVSAYGPDHRQTPAIDRLAGDGIVFQNALSPASWTLPSLASVMTGLSPSVHLVTGLNSRLSDRVTTLAETMQAHGYRTAAIVHNPLLSRSRNFSQGFSEYVEIHEPAYGDALGARALQRLLPAV